MENEQVDSPQNQPASTDKKGGRSKLERIIVWAVIGVLVAITAVEGLAQQGYSKTLTGFQTATDEATERLTLKDFESEHKNGFAFRTDESQDGKTTIRYKWPSLFRQYELSFIVEPGDEQVLVSYWSNDDPAAAISRPGKSVV